MKLARGTTILVLLAFCFAYNQVQAEEVERPNVLFIAIDDLNDWIGCLDGHSQAKTPNICLLYTSPRPPDKGESRKA